jgi:peroxiredoxin Q/BCP
MILGKIVPDFSLPDQYGNEFRLYENLDSWLILIFYPSEEGEICTRHLCNYRDNLKEFKKVGLKLVAISSDSVENHRRLSEEHNLNFPLLSDFTGEVGKMFTAFNGVRKKKVFVLNKQAKIVYEDFKLPFISNKSNLLFFSKSKPMEESIF